MLNTHLGEKVVNEKEYLSAMMKSVCGHSRIRVWKSREEKNWIKGGCVVVE